jgi:ABC-type lipoprotein export system ATPase subunit
VSDQADLVRCRGAGRTFGSGLAAVVAVHDLDCRVPAGARVAIVGASGSGKSTLLHLMAGLDAPTSGEVRWPALGERHQLRPGRVGIVFQGPSLLPPLDVLDNVALPLLLDGTDEPEARERAARALERLGIGELGAQLPEELSGGQAQRAAAARVLALRPRLILADEPTGQLDRHTGSAVVQALLETADESGAGIVVTTHDAGVAALFDARWCMADGRIVATESNG